jgi:vitamin B12 transporter
MKTLRLFCAALFLLSTLFPLFPQEAESPAGENLPAEEDLDEELLRMEAETLLFVEDWEPAALGTKETTQQMEVITRGEIQRHHAPDLATLLEETLDMDVTRYGPYGNQAKVNMRGFDTERIAILINGIPANSPRSGEFDMNSIDLNSVEKIEVIYGGSDTKYNVTGALGGVINIITLKKQEPGLSFGGSVSNTATMPGRYNEKSGEVQGPQWQDLADTQNLSLFTAYGAESSSFTANFFANRADNHFLYKDYYGYARRKEHNEVRDAGVSASWVQDLPAAATLLISGDLYFGRKNFPMTGTARAYTEQEDFSTRQNLIFDFPRAGTENLSAELSLSHTWSTLDYGKDSRYEDRFITAINRWSWSPLSWLTLSLGGDYRSIHVDSTSGGAHDGYNGGAYLTVDYSPAESFIFIGSVKMVTDGETTVAVPKAGWRWKPAEEFTLKNNYFHGFKFPDFDDLYWEQADGRYKGNRKLLPEDGLGADLTAEYRPVKELGFESSFYAQWTGDSIHWVRYSEFWTPENVGTAVCLGWDTRVRADIPLKTGPLRKLGVSLFYQYQKSWLLNDDLGFSDEMRIPYMPAHSAGAAFDFQWKSGSLLVSGRYTGLMHADTGNLLELEPHFLMNVTLNQELGKSLTFFIALRNVLNASYTSFAEYPMPGISGTAGVRVRFFKNSN